MKRDRADSGWGRHSGPVIDHPTVRRWYQDHDAIEPGRVALDNPDVVQLLTRVAPGGVATDLGGSVSLNLSISGLPLVLRVHKPFVTRQRLLGERALRTALVGRRVNVARPHGELLRCGPRWAEWEQYVPATSADLDPHSMIQALAELHLTLAAVSISLVPPFNGSFRSPSTLKRWLTTNRRDQVAGPDHDLDDLIDQVRRRWIPAVRLPAQLVHGDVRIDNLREGADGRPVLFDFGNAMRAPRVFDLSYTIAHLALDHDLSDTQFGDLIDHYDTHTAGNPLAQIERSAVAPYAACVCLLFEICRWGDEPMRGIARRFLS